MHLSGYKSFCKLHFCTTNPEKPTCFEQVGFQLYSSCSELYAPEVRDIYFAIDLPMGVKNEYTITAERSETISLLLKQKYHSVEDGI